MIFHAGYSWQMNLSLAIRLASFQELHPRNIPMYTDIDIIILLKYVSVAVRSVHAAVLARLSWEMSQTVRIFIDCQSFLLRVHISVRPSNFFIGEKPHNRMQKPSVQLIARSRLHGTA